MAPTRVLFLGIDAAEPSLVERWSDDGTLPTFAQLRSESAWGLTTNATGLYSGSVWPSFFTGLEPGRHGRYFFRQLVPGTYRTAAWGPERLPAPPFWSTLDAAGLRVAVVDVPKSPLTPLRHGIHVVDWGLHDAEGPPRSAPPGLVGEITERFGPDPIGPCGRAVRAHATERFCDLLVARIERKCEILCELVGRGPWDLFAGVFGDLHCAGHQLWAQHDPTHPLHDADAVARLGGDPLRDLYGAVDAALRRVLAAVGPETRVLVLLSHGMGAHYDATFLLDRILRRFDPLLRGDEAARAQAGGSGPDRQRRADRVESARSLWSHAPAALRNGLRPIAARLHDAAQIRDRAGRTCFQIPTNANCAGIRVNLAGREPRGIVEPGAAFERLCDELTARLHGLVNVETGAPVVEEVVRCDAVFHGDHRAGLPDLLVRWNRREWIRGVRSADVGTIAADEGQIRTGDHRNPGCFFARGPGIAPGRIRSRVRETDLAPTLAHWLGKGLEGVDGRVVPELGLARKFSAM